ncbi:hypothetical protein NPIL_181881 [Nephila pilipes]|uniref:Uncharacterized protein n=1 Tax=Nephila pilipes TaxID=299642 RepID=A0A8X6PFN4_NEPPI|nr:hypothetical protein NPIL_181881 [Nephila pilipes]
MKTYLLFLRISLVYVLPVCVHAYFSHPTEYSGLNFGKLPPDEDLFTFSEKNTSPFDEGVIIVTSNATISERLSSTGYLIKSSSPFIIFKKQH